VALIRSPKIVIACASLVASLGLAACGSSDDTTSSSTEAAPAEGGSAAVVDLADNSDLGTQILVDASGRTLYLFEKDDEGDESYCDGDCAQEWPPYTTQGQPQAGSGVDAAKLSSFKREDGATQVTYDDHPLYYYEGDSSAGDVNGNGLDDFGAEWYALDASGQTVEGDEGDESGESTNSDSGYSY
jgi:predicted lipoprotein with Yx(FWY)xxD motif